MPHATSHGPQAKCFFFCLPHRGRWPQAGGGLFVGRCRGWGVGVGQAALVTQSRAYFGVPTSQEPKAAYRFQNLTQPSPKGEHISHFANHKPQATGHMPHAAFSDSPGEADTVSRDPGSMRRAAPRIGLPSTSRPQEDNIERRGAQNHQGYRQRANHKLQATGRFLRLPGRG